MPAPDRLAAPAPAPVPRRRRSVLRRILIVAAALVLVLAAGVAAGLAWLDSPSALRFAVARAQQAVGADGGRLDIDGASGSLLSGVAIERLGWTGGGLDVQAAGLASRWSLPALLKRQVLVPEVSAASVVVRLPAPATDEPVPRQAMPMPGSFALPLRLDVERLAVGDLELIPGASGAAPVRLRDIEARLSYDEGSYRLDGFAVDTPYGRIDGGRLALGDAAPHPLRIALSARGAIEQVGYALDLTAEGDLTRLDVRAAGTVAEGTVRVDAVALPLAAMPLESASAALGQIDLRRLLPAGAGGLAPPQTSIGGDLSLARDAAADRWRGTVALRNTEAGALSAGRLPLASVASRFQLVDPDDPVERTLRLRELSLTFPPAAAVAAAAGKAGRAAAEGTITGSLDVTPGRTSTVAGVAVPRILAALDVAALDVSQFGPSAAAALPATSLGGAIRLSGEAFTVDLNQSRERMLALLPPALADAAGAATVRVRGRFEASRVRLEEARLRLGRTELGAAGEATLGPPYQVSLKGDLRQFDLGQWLPADAGVAEPWRTGRLSGEWAIDGAVAPVFDAMLSVRLVDSTLAGRPLAADVRGRLALADARRPARLQGAQIDLNHGGNRIRASGALGEPADALSVSITLNEPALLDARVGGRITLEGTVSGALERLRATAAVRGTRLVVAGADGDIRIASLRLDANGPVAAAVPPDAPLSVGLGLRGVRAAGRTVDRADLKVDGSLEAHRFDLSAEAEARTLALAGRGQAVLGAAPVWRARLASTTVGGSVPIRLTAPAELQVDAGALRVDALDVAVAGGRVSLTRLLVDWTGAPRVESRGGARDLPITRLIELAGGPDPGLAALAALRLDADWDVRGSGADDLSGTARIGLREAAGSGEPLGLTGDNGARVTLTGGRIDGRFDLALPSLSFTHRLTAPDIVVDGRLRVAGTVTGPLVRPQWNAAVSGSDLAVLQRSVGWRLTGGVLAARLDGRSLGLDTLKFASGEGSVELTGRAALLDAPRPAGAKPSNGSRASTLPFDGRFTLTATRFPVPIGPGQRVALSGSTELASGADGLSLRGRLAVDRGIIEIQGSSAPGLPDDVVVIDTRDGAVRAARDDGTAPAPGPHGRRQASPVRVLADVAVDLGDRLRMTGSGVAARLTGSLRVLGLLPDAPRLTGAVTIVDGSYEAYGQNLKVEKGMVRFNGPIDNPAIDLVAKRPFLPVEVGVSVTGTALSPKIALVSTPDMPDTAKLSWLVLGVDPANAPSAAQSLALRQAAQTLIGRGDGRHTPGIAERLGLDVFNFGYGSDTGPAQGVRETMAPLGVPGSQNGSAAGAQQEVVTLGKRIGSRLFVSYEQGVRGLWNLLRVQYTLTQRLSVRAQSGSDNAIDLLYAVTFD